MSIRIYTYNNMYPMCISKIKRYQSVSGTHCELYEYRNVYHAGSFLIDPYGSNTFNDSNYMIELCED